jgi:hypothetical protein
MRKKILLKALLLLFCLEALGQTVANQPPNLSLCHDNEGFYPLFDLTQQTPIILGNQDPQEYTVKYYYELSSAEANGSGIANPSSVGGAIIPNYTTYYARVNNSVDNTFAITSFTVQRIAIQVLQSDMDYCGWKPLSHPNIGEYYTGPNATGELIDTTTQEYIVYENGAQFYIHAEVNGCILDSPFTVIFNESPEINEPTPIYACDDDGDGVVFVDLNAKAAEITYGFTNLEVYFYHSLEEINNGDPAMWFPPAGQLMPVNSTVYVAVVTELGLSCPTVTSFQILGNCTDNQFSGKLAYYVNGGCAENIFPGINRKVSYSHGGNNYVTFTDNQGKYAFENVPDGISNVTATTEAFVSSPQNYEIIMPTPEPEVDFCLTPVNPVDDIYISYSAIGIARPGQVAHYNLVYRTLGYYMGEGTITLIFDDTRLDFLSSSVPMIQLGNTLTLISDAIIPFSLNSIDIQFTVMIPPVAKLGDILNFTATIDAGEDVNLTNNSNSLYQIIRDSYDPNDIAVREGEFITEEQADDYLNYIIRFQNKGTAEAIDVRVETLLDNNLDWSTFEPVAASHIYKVNQKNNEVEFLFKNINLAFENENTGEVPASNGYVIYRVKPKANVTLGDSMSAVANIYFDFNDPITTNEVTTTVQNVAGINKNNLDGFTVYPNPASGNVNLILSNAGTNSFDVAVVDMLGKTIFKNSFEGNNAQLNIADLSKGVYFISITADGKQATKKLIVK